VLVSAMGVATPHVLSNCAQLTTYSPAAEATPAYTAAFSNVNVPEADRRRLTTGFTAGR
jgi:hypothetical protein